MPAFHPRQTPSGLILAAKGTASLHARARPYRADNAAVWDRQGHSALNQLTARGMAERLITLELPAQPANRYRQRGGGEAGLDAALQAVLSAQESSSFRGLCHEFVARSAIGHTALRTPMRLLPVPKADLSRPAGALGQARI